MRPYFQMPADGWYNIAIAGEFPHSTGYVQVLDADAFHAIVEDVHSQMGRPNWPGILVDFDHDSLDPSRPSTAAGWLTDIEERPDGLWARIRWSVTGQKALEGGMFRFVSPVWLVDDCEDLGDKRLRPKRLMNCAITNAPNIKGMCPLTNRDTSADKPRLSPAGRPLPFVERLSVPVASLRAIEGTVLENARAPLSEKQKRFLWAQSHGGGEARSPYQSPNKAGRDAAHKGGSPSEILEAKKNARLPAKRYHNELQKARDEWDFKANELRLKQQAKQKKTGKPERTDWTRARNGKHKSGKKLKSSKGLPTTGGHGKADIDSRRGKRQDKTQDLFNQAASDFNKRKTPKHRRKVSNSSRVLGPFLANTSWEDMSEQQQRWWWAHMLGPGSSGASATSLDRNPYLMDALAPLLSPLSGLGLAVTSSYRPALTRSEADFWNEVYSGVEDPQWKASSPEVETMWESVSSDNNDPAWDDFFQRSSDLSNQLAQHFAEIKQQDKTLTPAQRDALEYLSQLRNDWTTDFGAGALRGFGNMLDTTSNFIADAATGWFDLADLGVKLAGLGDTAVGDFVGSVHSGVHSLVDPVNNLVKDKTGINWAVGKLRQAYDDLGRTGDWADVTSKISSGVFVAAATMALGLLGQAAKGTANLAKFQDALKGGTLNPLNPFHTPASIPKPGVGFYEIAEIKPTQKQWDEILRKAFDVESRHAFPEGVGYMEERASLRSLEEAVSAWTDIGRDTYNGQVKAFEEALESWRNAYSGAGLSSKLSAAERARQAGLADLPTTAAERSAIEQAAYAREAWGMPDAQANAAYMDDLSRLSQNAGARKFGDSMGRDVFEKAAAKEELARMNAGASTKPPAAAAEAGTAAPAPTTGEEALAALRAKMSERGASQAEWDQLGEWEARVRSEVDRLAGKPPVAEAGTAPSVPVTSAAEAEARSAGILRETPPKIGETGTLPGIPANTGKPLGKAGIPPPGHTGSYHPDMPREGETLASYFERTGNHSANPEWRNPNVSDSTYLSGIAEGLEYPTAADFKKAESLVYPASWAKASPEAKWKAAHSVHVNPFQDTSRGDIYEALRSVDGEAVFPRPTPKTTGTVSPEVAAQVREMEIRSDMRRFQDRAQVLSEAKRRSILDTIIFPNLQATAGESGKASVGTVAAIAAGALPILGIVSAALRYASGGNRNYTVSSVGTTTVPSAPAKTAPSFSYVPPSFPSNIVNFALAGKYGTPSVDGSSAASTAPARPKPSAPSAPTEQEVSDARSRAGASARMTAASIQEDIDRLSRERYALIFRDPAREPVKPPTEYRNIQQVRLEAASQGGTPTEILAAVQQAKVNNQRVARLKSDIWKARRHARSQRQADQAEAEIMADYMAEYDSQVRGNQLADSSAEKRLRQIDRELSRLTEAHNRAIERAVRAEQAEERRILSKAERDQRAYERDLARWEREQQRANAPTSVRGEVSRERKANTAFFTALETCDFTAAGQLAPTYTRDQLDKASRVFHTVMAARTPEQKDMLRQYYLPYADPSGFVDWSQGVELNPYFTFDNPLATERQRHAMITQKQTEDRYFRRY